MSSESPVDLRALDPTQDRARLQRIVARIMSAAAPGLAVRRRPPSPVQVIVSWRRAMLAAAAVVVLVSGAVLTWVPASPTAPSRAHGLATTLGMPSEVAYLVAADRPPAPAQIFTWFAGAR